MRLLSDSFSVILQEPRPKLVEPDAKSTDDESRCSKQRTESESFSPHQSTGMCAILDSTRYKLLIHSDDSYFIYEVILRE